jgi:hypothetical protein
VLRETCSSPHGILPTVSRQHYYSRCVHAHEHTHTHTHTHTHIYTHYVCTITHILYRNQHIYIYMYISIRYINNIPPPTPTPTPTPTPKNPNPVCQSVLQYMFCIEKGSTYFSHSEQNHTVLNPGSIYGTQALRGISALPGHNSRMREIERSFRDKKEHGLKNKDTDSNVYIVW